MTETVGTRWKAVRPVRKATWVGVLTAGMALLMGGAAWGQGAGSLAERLDGVVAPAKYRAEVGACAIELPSGRVLFEKNADLPLAPASNMKLLTTAVALDLFGADHRFQTRLARKGNTLALVGGGDPGFGDAKIAAKTGRDPADAYIKWAEALRAAGQEVEGLVFDDSIFESQWRHGGWNQRDMGSWFCAPVGGLCLNDSCVDVEVEVSPQGTCVLLTPACSLFEIINKSQVGKGDEVTVRRLEDTWQLLVSGKCGRKTPVYSVTVLDPGMFAAVALHDVLKAGPCPKITSPRREKVTDQAGNLLEGWELVGTAETGMADILERCNTDSQNLFAEALFKQVGAKATGSEGSWASGRVAAMQFLRKYDLPTEGIVLSDGSGLSKENRVSARLLAGLLARMHGQEDWQVWVDSMAVGGDSGTLRKRFRGVLEGKVFAKTGYISGVSALSGYIDCGQGKYVAFSFIYNKITTTGPAKQAQEQACQILYREMQSQ